MARSNQETSASKTSASKEVSSKSSTKPVKTKQNSTKTIQTEEIVSTEQRLQMIRDTAYNIAEQRGFTPGNEHTDWLQAETRVDALLLK
ncbi:MAG: DUF2934 domain-containing protein [Gammaproteobacteria bacterium]|nr:DUF2934 domain-containing protein [Gammaproteobacteria bacterium]